MKRFEFELERLDKEGKFSPLPNFTDDRRNPLHLHPWPPPLLIAFSVLAVAAVTVFLLSFYPPANGNGTGLVQDPPTLKLWVTGYSAEEGYDEWTRTSNGTVPGWGTVAVDPEAIPYGSVLFVPAYAEICGRYAVALDCGSAINGYHIDLWTETNVQSYSLTGWHEVKILRWGWNHWMCEPGRWGLELEGME